MLKRLTEELFDKREIVVSGMGSAAAASMISYVYDAIAKFEHEFTSIVWVHENLSDAEDAQINLRYFLQNPIVQDNADSVKSKPEVHLFQSLPSLPTPTEPVPVDILSHRLKAIQALLKLESEVMPVLITTAASFNEPLTPINEIRNGFIRFQVGEILEPDMLLEKLYDLGYRSVYDVDKPGQFKRITGGILDFFPFASEYPLRIEFFDDEIESIRFFNPNTQVSFASKSNVSILLTNDPGAFPNLEGGKLPPSQSFFEFIGENALIIHPGIKHLTLAHAEIKKSWWRRTGEKSQKSFLKRFDVCSRIQLTQLPGRLSHDFKEQKIVDLLDADINVSLKNLDEQAQTGIDTRIITSSDADTERISELIESEMKTSKITVHHGDIVEGFHLLDPAIICIPYFALARKKRVKASFTELATHTKAIESYLELKDEDLVVHVTYGVAKFKGLKKLTFNKRTGDYLCLEFDKGRIYYAPVIEIELIQKYIGSKQSEPPLSVFRSYSWTKKKLKVEQAVVKLASEYLEIAAMRQISKGIGYKVDQSLYHPFVASFPFHETPDQDKVSLEIEMDMRKPMPMDRLLCGDVGFGKTELAMRSAFIAIMNEFQVAMLVPTKVLASQHIDSFLQRFAEFPVTVHVLTQFQTRKEQKIILEELITGKVDILIGTHRILSDDVKFKNLGLIIIDEEQRFGVNHKEKLKKMRYDSDILTLTATPIPRTLHLALLGVRDISTLTSAPQNRKPVLTRVTYFDDGLIRDAIRRELARKGQVFFLHNNIAQLGIYKKLLLKMMPKIRIGTVHSKLNRQQIAQVMGDFRQGVIDVLLCTTIIEAGLDYPNANTLIVNNANRFGLSQLHQLRGRVGREHKQAFAYFLVNPDITVSEIAQMRLNAVDEYSHLGAGFDIALRDLEIRGAGNVLGKEQSGHIAAIGYELYVQLLQRSIAKLSNKKPDIRLLRQKVVIDMGQDFIIPDSFIPQANRRLEFYQRISRAYDEEQLEGVASEMQDRFGKLPDEAEQYIITEKLRMRLADLSVTKIFYRVDMPMTIEVSQMSEIEDFLLPHSLLLHVINQHEVQLDFNKSRRTPLKVIEILQIFDPKSEINSK
ncbi:MAG: transcription-repair coupling factor [Planctomycetes bacterium]|nr:transcription-repair coupling factor [Planctomycetota bacterium]